MARQSLSLQYKDGKLLMESGLPLQATVEHLLNDYNAIHVKGFFSPEECKQTVQTIYQLKSEWSSDYGGEQYSIPQNYYASYNANSIEQYHKNSYHGMSLVHKRFGDIVDKLLSQIRSLTSPAPFILRDKFCGPGITIFPNHEELTRDDAGIHVDMEGLLAYQDIIDKVSVFSVICMLQAPDFGGGLRIWDMRYSQSFEEEEFLQLARADKNKSSVIEYSMGDMVVIDSLCPHQILKFAGERDRITLNLFSVKIDSLWSYWF